MDCILYPNPNKGIFTLSYTGKTAEKLTISVYDITGKMVAFQAWDVTAGTNKRELDLSALPKGMYLTKVSSAAGYNTIKTTIE